MHDVVYSRHVLGYPKATASPNRMNSGGGVTESPIDGKKCCHNIRLIPWLMLFYMVRLCDCNYRLSNDSYTNEFPKPNDLKKWGKNRLQF